MINQHLALGSCIPPQAPPPPPSPLLAPPPPPPRSSQRLVGAGVVGVQTRGTGTPWGGALFCGILMQQSSHQHCGTGSGVIRIFSECVSRTSPVCPGCVSVCI